ncbi:MAG: pyridoxal 5'-phosphate synthase glutaminase subunit PdxT [Eggerthellales bacterium]|nr:pyridoxal 5'-phosphate synthase glutaminase subunit PdxT [Eggerthellales bacterium]
MASQKVGVLAVQGAFAEHEAMLAKLGAETVQLRQASDLEKPFDRLILPGGESTSQGRVLRDLGMLDTLRQRIADGMPVFGTCAGLILLAQRIDEVNGDGSVVDEQHNSTWLATLPVTVRRNAYGRQLGSFHTVAPFERLGEVPMTFIRAPFITQADSEVQVLSVVNDNIVAVRYGNQLGVSFHPELDESLEIHRMFLSF